MYTAPQELIDRLCTPLAATEQDVLDYLEGQYAAEPHSVSTPIPSDFFKGAEDLEQYRQAGVWWPEPDLLPAQLQMPTLYTLCWRYFDADLGSTFLERLGRAAQAVVSWQGSSEAQAAHRKRAPIVPGESATERRARLNREAQARFRARRQAVATGSEADRAATAAYRAYLDVCAQRKAALAQLNAQVEAARAVWVAAKAAASKACYGGVASGYRAKSHPTRR